MEWLQKHWSNAVTLGCIFIAALVSAWQQAATSVSASMHIPRLQGGWNYVPLILLITAGAVLLISRRSKANQLEAQMSQPPATTIPAGIPTLSALLGQNQDITFNA